MTSPLSIRRGLIALRVRHQRNPKIARRAPLIVNQVEQLDRATDPDQIRRLTRKFGRAARELRALMDADRGGAA